VTHRRGVESREESGPIASNWKVALENYLECYYCPTAHPGFSKVIDVAPDAYRLPRLAWCAPRPSSATARIRPKGDVTVQRGLDSGMVPQGRLMTASEQLIADFQRRVRDALVG
jgi:phenylpropionate dioxygenase-like ring-hydroxylating dioxygenase large terminal subunit